MLAAVRRRATPGEINRGKLAATVGEMGKIAILQNNSGRDVELTVGSCGGMFRCMREGTHESNSDSAEYDFQSSG